MKEGNGDQLQGMGPHASARTAPRPRRLVLSRKGFDSSLGGMPSPILPDGRLLSLPIPSKSDVYTFRDMNAQGLDLAMLLADLGRGDHDLDTRVHLDPDLDRAPIRRLRGWRPALGQSGAAQTHLLAQGVGPGDVFLFFGWFRQVEHSNGRWRFARHAPNLHVLFGWLEVDEVLSVFTRRTECLKRHPWIADHPHVVDPASYANERNTLYIAPKNSAHVPGAPGGGLFSHFSPSLQLTAPSSTTRSVWSLPGWFHPTDHARPLSYHTDLSRWSRHGDRCQLRTVAQGQEFVLDLQGRPQAAAWIRQLLAQSVALKS